MTGFFKVLSLVSVLAWLVAFWLGDYKGTGFSLTDHMLWGLVAGLLAVSAHCLVFAIFSGAGKDARELAQQLKLSENYIKQIRDFRKNLFPKAMSSILLVLLTAIAGGALSAYRSTTLNYAHRYLAIAALAYNLLALIYEAIAIRDNKVLLKNLNRDVALALHGMSPQTPIPVSAIPNQDWGSHVYALAKFLCFLGINVWLPFLYVRFVMGYRELWVLPFLLLSALFLAAGFFLRFRYRNYRPT